MEEIFNKINILYAEYAKFSAAGNTENAIKSIEEKIIMEVWKSKKEYKEFPVEVVETVRNTLLKYSHDSDNFEEEISFSQYLFGSLGNSISTSKEKETLADKNAGMHISDFKYRHIKQVKAVFENYRKMHPDQNSEDIIEKIIQKSILDIDEDEIRECLKMSKAATLGTETPNEDEDGSILIEEVFDIVDKNPVENDYALHERRLKNLKNINDIWKKESNPMLSELLTVTLLEYGCCLEDLESCSFINKEIRDAYFAENSERKLPQNQEIAEKYGLTKSAATQARKRFLEKVKESLKK